MRPTITGPDTCTVDMGTASLTSKDFRDGPADGRGSVMAGGRLWRFQHVSVGNPQCAIRVGSLAELEALDLPAIGPADRRRGDVRKSDERVVVHGAGAEARRRASARASSSAAWGRRCPPARARRARRSRTRCNTSRRCARRAVTVLLDGGELEVQVGEDLRVNLTGWARPVFEGRLSEEFEKELHETE